MKKQQVSIIIVTYNSSQVIMNCLKSIYEKTTSDTFEIIIVDNNSSDDSITLIKESYADINIIQNSDNVGFGTANNIAFKQAKGDYILVLNPDTILINDIVNLFTKYLSNPENRDIACLGCKIFWKNGELQPSIFRYPTLFNLCINILLPERIKRKNSILGRSRYIGIDRDKACQCDVIGGCCMFIRREVIEQLGGFDEDFFLFGEEVELCYRITRSGWKIVYFPEAIIEHDGGVGIGWKNADINKSLMITKEQLLVFQKLYGNFVAYFANFLMLIRDIPRTLLWLILQLTPSSSLKELKFAVLPALYRARLHFVNLYKLNWIYRNE